MLILLALLAWCVLSVPVAVVVGRALRAAGTTRPATGREEYGLAA